MGLTSEALECLPDRTIVSMGVLISKYARHGQCAAALDCFQKMLTEGVKPDLGAFSWVLKACGNLGAIHYGRKVHAEIVERDFHTSTAIHGSLIHMYANCGYLNEACKVFSCVRNSNVITCSVMITGYIQHGCGFQALEFYRYMQQHGLKPDRVIFLCLLKACSSVEAIKEGRLLHDDIIRADLELDVTVGSTLLDMYSKYGSLDEAQEIFNRMPIRNIVPWNALMAGYVQHGNGLATLELFERVQQEALGLTKATYLGIIKACGSVKATSLGRRIHIMLLESGTTINGTVGNSLIDMYAKCGIPEKARRVFDELTTRDDVSWSSLIAGYVHNGCYSLAFELFEEVRMHDIKPDKFFFSSMLKACGNMKAIDRGQMLHGEVKKHGLEFDVVVGNTLIDMYAKCGRITDAREVFDNLPSRSEISWSAMISGYTLQGLGLSALEVFERMLEEGIPPGVTILPIVLKACGTIGALECGHQVHDLHVRQECKLDFTVGNALIDMYIKCESLKDARKVFDSLSGRDVVSWSTIISGCVQDDQGIPALHLYTQSQKEGITPDRVLILCVLKACGSAGTIEMGKIMHDKVIRQNLDADLAVGNTLLDMYTKCRSLEESLNVFDKLSNKNVVSWNAMIAGLAQHGYCRSALECFGDMLCQRIEPDSWTFSSILAACSEAALVKEGHRLFKAMETYYGIIPGVEHYNCIIDLFSRAGQMPEAKKLLRSMPVLPDITTWMSLLTASRMYGYVDLGLKCFNEVAQLEPDAAAIYALLSHMYADFNLFQDACKVQELKKCSSAWKKPGKACIEIGDSIQEFIVGEKSTSDTDLSRGLSRLLKEQGYTPRLDMIFETSENETGDLSRAWEL
ncbi:hypothetical protein GOP47_0007929 [Adiantum capillus-veneris]|uniref:Pentatricopeptide repeat-containing protein n=1 Tax=Adiantum capillus-veneris TaxID=13818 RepID=A0A9D4V1M6_ADICA|nr:hypothetical protein GOP47_0007929 [Adiantum capillus-veneris]